MSRYYALTSDKVTKIEKENMQKVRALASECMVLLENDGTLPLPYSTTSVALYGSGIRHTIKGGTGSGDASTRENINIEQGMEEAGYIITTKGWLDDYDKVLLKAKTQYHEKIKKEAESKGVPIYSIIFDHSMRSPGEPVITLQDVEKSACDTAIYVITRNSGEGCDRNCEEGDYYLSDWEISNITFVAQHYLKSIVLLNTGGVIDTTALKRIPGINAILLIGQSGNIGGYAVADVLSGKTVPSGKLADTWAEKYEDYPYSSEFSHNSGNTDDAYYKEDIFVGYRYFDTFNVTPSYCFGYGKSYTNFSINTLRAETDSKSVYLKVKVTNVGERFCGKEVVQVYYSAPKGTVDKPYQELIAFGKTRLLAPGESEILNISFDVTSMAYYDASCAAYRMDKGDYIIRVGNCSRDTKASVVVSLSKGIITQQLKNVFPDDESFEKITCSGVKPYMSPMEESDKNSAIRLIVDASKFQTETVTYETTRQVYSNNCTNKHITFEDVKLGKATVEQLVSQLTIEEMAALCVGKYGTDKYRASMDSTCVPGAAASTCDYLIKSRKIPNLILSDGPAGLQLQTHFKVGPDGQLLKGGEGFGGEILPFPKTLPEGTIDYYQYCTAIPIATNLSQSWNMELIQSMGKIVGSEMLQYHVDLLLAPGMNIHRNPLCGRNFEYYSEDPLLSGRCAASYTLGVQRTGRHGTTIKHFAGNNQEDNRMYCNSHISERALREIYLKGFEIAIKEAQPFAVMTSYNLINGIHSANQYDLLQTVARDEWGFQGVVMTDWYSAQEITRWVSPTKKYSYSSSVKCIYAGNDMMMPGCERNMTEIVEAVKEGSQITLADLQYCTIHILKTVLKCR